MKIDQKVFVIRKEANDQPFLYPIRQGVVKEVWRTKEGKVYKGIIKGTKQEFSSDLWHVKATQWEAEEIIFEQK